MNSKLEGCLAGLAATGPMTWMLWATDPLAPRRARRRLPPLQIVQTALRKTGLDDDLADEKSNLLATAAHYAFGAAAGGVLAVAADRIDLPKPVTGALVGSLVWAVSYLGWLPAVGLRKTAARDYPGRNVQMIAAHLVWGRWPALC